MLNIVFFCILCLLIYALREINRNLNQEKGFSTKINSLYIQNIYLTCFKLSLYICGTLLLLLTLRYLNLGSVINLSPIAIHNLISVSSLILITEILMIIVLYRKVLDLVFYKDIYRLHVYLLKYPKYEDYMEIVQDTYNQTARIFRRFDLYITYISDPSWDLEKSYKQRKRYFPDTVYPAITFKIRAYIIQRRYLLALFKGIRFIIEFVRVYMDYKIIQAFLLYIVFLYDLILSQIYYTYYALFIYLVIQNINKFRKFMREKDFMFDRILYEHLYKTSIQTNYKIIGIADELINYLDKECKIYYILELEPIAKIRYNYVKKIYMILGITIAMFLFIDISTIVLVIPLAITCATVTKDNVLSKTMFWLNILLQTMICSIIYIKRNMILYMNETIWDYGITITQTFSIDEKLDFIYKYLAYTIKHTKGFTIDQKVYLIDLLTNISYKDLISYNTTIVQLREYIDSLLHIYQRLETAYISCRINVYTDTLLTTDIETISDNTLMILLSCTLLTCVYILPPVFMFIDAYIQITNPKLHIVLVVGKKTYRHFLQILKTNYPDYFDN